MSSFFRLDSIVDTNNLPVIVTGMYIFRGEVKSGSTMVPDLEAPRGKSLFRQIVVVLADKVNQVQFMMIHLLLPVD